MKFNKKGFFPGWEYIAGFFIMSIILIFVIGMYDFTIVEIYEPIHKTLNESLVTLNATNNIAYTGFENNYVSVHNYDLPFNLIYIFIFFNAVIFSIINVGKQMKLEPMELIFKTIGGMIFFLYLMEIIIFKILDYFQVQVIEYLFEDLIISYIPFHAIINSNGGLIILSWGITLILINWYFGKTEQEFKGVFGQ